MAKYVAKQRGYDGTTLREKGDVFEYDGPKGDWMASIKEQGVDSETEEAVEQIMKRKDLSSVPKAGRAQKALGLGSSQAEPGKTKVSPDDVASPAEEEEKHSEEAPHHASGEGKEGGLLSRAAKAVRGGHSHQDDKKAS